MSGFGEDDMKTSSLYSALMLIALASSEGIAQWENLKGSLSTAQTAPAYISSLAFEGKYLFVGENGVAGDLWRSSDAGKTWTKSLKSQWVHALAVADGRIYVGTEDNGVFFSTDHGTTWTRTSNGLPSGCDVISLAVRGQNLIAGCVSQSWSNPSSYSDFGVYLSSDSGKTWVPGGALGGNVLTLFYFGQVLLAGTLQGVWRSLDDGQHWTRIDADVSRYTAESFAAIGEDLVVGGEYGFIFQSTDKGAHWSQVAGDSFYAVGATGTGLVASLMSGNVVLSSDNGTTWEDISQGLVPGGEIRHFATGEGYLFAGDEMGRVLRRPLAQMTTSAHDEPLAFPHDFALMQNYPNPFNPWTLIRYTVGIGSGPSDRDSRSGGPENLESGVSKTTLVVYDVLGRQVATLVDEVKAPGTYVVRLDGSGLASGTYFYRLTTGKYVNTKKLMLTK
jgi:photosystem II stability/assembly factor-like uncharacterized protein